MGRRRGLVLLPPVLLLAAAAAALLESRGALAFCPPLPHRRPPVPTSHRPPPQRRLAAPQPLWGLVPGRDGRGGWDWDDGAPPASAVGALVRSHAAVLRALCPAVTGCRVYLPSELLLLDPVEGEEDGPELEEQGQGAEDWRLADAALGAYLASAAPLPTTAGSGGLDGAFLLARPGGSSAGAALPPALLAPLGADGWILVEVEDDAAAQWGALAPALECLGVALTVAGRERAAGQRAQGTFRRLLREIRQPLGALRTFGKLLLRRLEKTDAEGLNQELTSNVLVSSDALVEVLQRFQGGDEEDDDAKEASSAAAPSTTPKAPGAIAPVAAAAAASSGTRALCDPRAVMAPVVAAARAISGRDGVKFQTFLAEGLPRVRIGDERGFQEALGTMVELALASSLAGAAAAAAADNPQGDQTGQGQGHPKPEPPAVSLEVTSVDGVGVQFIVRDNGLGDMAVLRGGRELGRAREAIERMGARLEIRRSESLGGTHMAVSFEEVEGRVD